MNKRLTLAVIFMTIALDFFNLGLIFPIFTVMIFEGFGGLISSGASEFHKNALFGVLMAAFPLGQFFGAPVLGRLADSYSRRMLLILTLIGTILTLILSAYGTAVQSLFLLLVGRFLGGLMAGNMTLAYATLAEFSLPEEKVRNFAIIPLATGVGFAGGPYVAGMISDMYAGTQWALSLPFLVAAVLTMANLILAVWKFPESLGEKVKKPFLDGFKQGLLNITKTLRPNPMRPYFWILFLTISANLVFVQFAGSLVVEKFQVGIIELSYLYANIGVSVALGHIFLTRNLGKYFSVETTLAGSLVCLTVLLAVVFVIPNMMWMHIVTALIMLGFAVAYTNAMTLVSNKAPKEAQGETMGVAVSIQSLSEFLPAVLLGLVAASLLGLPILMASLMTLLCGIVLSRASVTQHAQN